MFSSHYSQNTKTSKKTGKLAHEESFAVRCLQMKVM